MEIIENKWLYTSEYEGMQGIILSSRGGAKNSTNNRNPDYMLLLQYILELLKEEKQKNVQIYVASNVKDTYPNVEDRLLSIDGSKKFNFEHIILEEFTTSLCNQIRLSGQTKGSKGGNSTKRLFFHLQTNLQALSSECNTKSSMDSKHFITKDQITSVLESFKGNNTDNPCKIQKSLLKHLELELKGFTWSIEFKANEERKDRFDIHGVNKSTGQVIVVELDPHRADSIAKKFVSRLAIMINAPLLYIAFLYPGTKNMNKKEADKYLNDCNVICNALSSLNNNPKEFIGYYMP